MSSFVVPTLTPSYYDQNEFTKYVEIKVTQGPIAVSIGEAPNSEYLYKNALVSFIFTGFRLQGRRYLNLDNLSDNGVENSDIILDLSTGSGGHFVQIYPANYAKYYFSNKDYMDYDLCVNQFPVDYKYTINDPQSFQLGTSKRYCVLTNQGHMAVIYYVQDSDLPDAQGVINFSLVINVYRNKALSIFTPAPAETPGPSPTPTNIYSVWGLTDTQANELDKKIQEFIVAVTANDKETISKMMVYPVIEYTGSSSNNITINDPNELLSMYDRIFPETFVRQLTQATIDQNVDGNTIVLKVQVGLIYFTPDGKIRGIYYSGD